MFPELNNFWIHSVFNLWNLEISQLLWLDLTNLPSWLQKTFKDTNKIPWFSLNLIFLVRTSILFFNLEISQVFCTEIFNSLRISGNLNSC